MAECFPDTSNWCWNENIYHGVKCFEWSYRLDSAVYKNVPLNQFDKNACSTRQFIRYSSCIQNNCVAPCRSRIQSVTYVCRVCQVERHLRKLDQEVSKFKMELEADNAGITEMLEKRRFGFAGSLV